MPGSINWESLDNFFTKLTQMESPRKNNDCYFYYYSTCTKGDSCTFRHEPTALGCETVCSFWQQGKCLNQHCNFRHMELRKNRKMIPCYWENQPGGCLKPHCPFLHKTPKEAAATDGAGELSEPVPIAKTQDRQEWNRRPVAVDGGENEAGESARPNIRRVSQGSEASYGSPAVDPLVVNFEEESDNESVPTTSPTKQSLPQRSVRVKTLEEIRLERVQAESAAYYSYPGAAASGAPASAEAATDLAGDTADDLRKRILTRLNLRKDPTDFKVLTLEEIRKRRNKADGEETVAKRPKAEPDTDSMVVTDDGSQDKSADSQAIFVKTLAEIRAEKLKMKTPSDGPDRDISSSEPEMLVSSSSNIHRRTKRKVSMDSAVPRSKPKLVRSRETNSDGNVESASETSDTNGQLNGDNKAASRLAPNELESELSRNADSSADSTNAFNENFDKRFHRISNKSDDCLLLLDDIDMENSNVSLAAAEDIIQNIDDILND